MPDPTHITVTAPPGVLAPIHRNDGAEPGGGLLSASAGSIIPVRYSQAVRRSIARGDLIPCNMDGARCSIALAACSAELPPVRIPISKKEPK